MRAIDIFERTLGTDHPQLAPSLNNRALLLKTRVRIEGLFQEFSWGAHVSEVLLKYWRSTRLHKFAEAGPLHRRLSVTQGNLLGPEHLDTAQSLNSSGLLDQRRWFTLDPAHVSADSGHSTRTLALSVFEVLKLRGRLWAVTTHLWRQSSTARADLLSIYSSAVGSTIIDLTPIAFAPRVSG